MIEVNSKTISEFKGKFSDVLQKENWKKLPTKDLFSLLHIENKNFHFIAKIILNRKDKEAYLYQLRFFEMLSQIKKSELRNTLLEARVGSDTLIDKIKKFTKEAEGEAALYGWVLCAQYSGSNSTLDDELTASFAKRNMLPLFSAFLTPAQYKENLTQSESSSEDGAESDTFDSNEVDEKLSQIEVNLGHDSQEMQEETLRRLTTFIEMTVLSIVSNQADKIFGLIKKRLDLPSALYALIALIKKIPADSLKADEIFNLLEERLDQRPEKFLQIAIFQALSALVKKIPADSFKVDDIFNFILKALNHSSEFVQAGALNTLATFIKKIPAGSLKIEDIFSAILKALDHSSESVQAAALNALAAFIKKIPADSLKIEDIFSAILKALNHSSESVQAAALNALASFIKKIPADCLQVNQMFDLLKKSFNHGLEFEQSSALTCLAALIEKMPADSLDDADNMLNFLQESLTKRSLFVKVSALVALAALIEKIPVDSLNADVLFNLFKNSLNYSAGIVRQTTLVALAALIKKMPASFFKSDDILSLVMKGLSQASASVQGAALQVLTVCLHKEMLIPQDVWEKGLICAWQPELIVPKMRGTKKFQEELRALRFNALNAFTALIKHSPSAVIEDKSDITEIKKVARFLYPLVSATPIANLSDATIKQNFRSQLRPLKKAL